MMTPREHIEEGEKLLDVTLESWSLGSPERAERIAEAHAHFAAAHAILAAQTLEAAHGGAPWSA